jgi:hypothetical protein
MMVHVEHAGRLNGTAITICEMLIVQLSQACTMMHSYVVFRAECKATARFESVRGNGRNSGPLPGGGSGPRSAMAVELA